MWYRGDFPSLENAHPYQALTGRFLLTSGRIFLFLLKYLIQLDLGIQYSGRHGNKFGNVFKIALNRTTPCLHELKSRITLQCTGGLGKTRRLSSKTLMSPPPPLSVFLKPLFQPFWPRPGGQLCKQCKWCHQITKF